jgi:hypothetical protein
MVACALLVASCATTPTHADQPKMHAALRSLQEARAQLAAAAHDKGGWRVDAIESIDRAIAQVQRGIEFDRRTLSPNENRR